MAGRIQTSLRITWTSGDGESITGVLSQSLVQIGNAAFANVQTIGATSETIDTGDVSGDCLLFFKNNNPEWKELTTEQQATYTDEADYNTKNTVYVGSTNPATSSSANTHKLKPGSGAFESGTLAAHYAIRDTNDVQLVVVIIEK